MPSKSSRLWPDSATILERSRGIFFAQWEDLLHSKLIALKTADPDDIHDLRVSSRRFRAALELLYPFAPKGPKSEIRRNVRTLTRKLGGLRNIDEALLFFRSQTHVAISDGDELFCALSGLRSKEFKRIEKALKAFEHQQLDRLVREMVAGLNDKKISGRSSFSLLAYFSETSIRQYVPIHLLLAGSTEPERRASRHTLRIAIKKWRYFFELTATILGRDYTRFIELLKEYQSVLGRMNDVAEFDLLVHALDLPATARKNAEMALVSEQTCLLQKFSELIDTKPLTYTFLI